MAKKQRLACPVSWNSKLIFKFEVWQVRSHVITDCSGNSVVLHSYWAPCWMQRIPKRLLYVKCHIWPWFFLHPNFVFQKLLLLVCGRVGVGGIMSSFFFFLDDVPYTEMWINGKWNNMCAMHERQQEEAEPWLKSGISGWIREEANANMLKAAGVDNHFYLWNTPCNWDDNN